MHTWVLLIFVANAQPAKVEFKAYTDSLARSMCEAAQAKINAQKWTQGSFGTVCIHQYSPVL
jgi:hypothetical protein